MLKPVFGPGIIVHGSKTYDVHQQLLQQQQQQQQIAQTLPVVASLPSQAASVAQAVAVVKTEPEREVKTEPVQEKEPAAEQPMREMTLERFSGPVVVRQEPTASDVGLHKLTALQVSSLNQVSPQPSPPVATQYDPAPQSSSTANRVGTMDYGTGMGTYSFGCCTDTHVLKNLLDIWR